MTGCRRLEGRPVLVTGGGSGIGRGASERIAEEGGSVGVADIRLELAEAGAAAINDAGGRAIAIACDVADEPRVEAAVAATVDAFGGLDGLVANAGTAGSGWIHETARVDWDWILGVNLTGAFLCAKHAIPPMIEGGGGSIVMTSSIAGSVVGVGGSAASYAVSKAGLIALAKQIAVDYGSQGIRANAIQPAAVEGSNLGKHAVEDHARQVSPAATLPRPKA